MVTRVTHRPNVVITALVRYALYLGATTVESACPAQYQGNATRDWPGS